MAKERKSKKQQQRDERRKKKRDRELQDDEVREETREAKRQRMEEGAPLFFEDSGGAAPGEHAGQEQEYAGQPADEREFFGLLSDGEQEYFRRADELLELNDFSSAAERRVFVGNVFREARSKELKLASSQSCSRLVERLMQIATARQRRRLYRAFAGHAMTLVTHRFASHCCEQLLAAWGRGDAETTDETGDEEDAEKDEETEEELLLAFFHELEPHFAALLTDRFASHTLRVLLVVLAGRPLDGVGTRLLLRSRKKETVTVAGGRAAEPDSASADVIDHVTIPPAFTATLHGILVDLAGQLDSAALRVLATHPTGNPVLQLLVELEMAAAKTEKKKAKTQGEAPTLVGNLLPGAPETLADAQSPAAELVRTLVYDRIGSRLLEMLVSHGPARLFKALYMSTFVSSDDKTTPMATFLRNETACYPAMRVLERLGRDDLTAVVEKQILAAPSATSGRTAAPALVVAQLIDRQRFSALRTLFERCAVRGVPPAVLRQLTDALRQATGSERQSTAARLIERLCWGEGRIAPDDELKDEKKEAGAAAHGCQLVAALLAIPGQPASAAQMSLLALSGEQLARLATDSTAGAALVVAAIGHQGLSKKLNTKNPLPKQLVARLLPHCLQLAASSVGHVILLSIVLRPTRTTTNNTIHESDASDAAVEWVIGVPFHLKDSIASQLVANEDALRACWTGRNVWRAWRCDLWRNRRGDWVRWMKAGEPEGLQTSTAPVALQNRKEGEKERKKKGKKEEK